MLGSSMCFRDDRRQTVGQARDCSTLSSLMRCVFSCAGVLVSAEQRVSDRRSLFDRPYPASHSGHWSG